MTPEERKRKVKWLSRYRILENQIKRLEAEKERWKARATNTVPAPVHFKYIKNKEKLEAMTKEERRRNNMPPIVIHGSGSGLGIDDCVAETDKLEQKLIDKIYEAIKTQRAIDNAIDCVEDDRLRLILSYRYIDGLKWENICCEANYSWKWIHILHNEALEKIEI
jgi:hypothetical protein